MARFTGAAELRYVARLVERQRVSGLRKELAKAQRQAFKPLLPAIKAEAATLPSGYAPVMARTVKLSIRNRGLVTMAEVYARGRRRERDVNSVDAGTLRHPLWGNRNSWHVTRVRPGFVARPVRNLGERIARESLDATERVANEIAKG